MVEMEDYLRQTDEKLIIESERTVTGTVSANTMYQWIKAILIGLAIIFLYCLLPFSKVKIDDKILLPAISAIIAVLHDVIIILGIIVVFKIELGIAVFTSILFIIGYSINDSLVLLFRINHNHNRIKKDEITSISEIEKLKIKIKKQMGDDYFIDGKLKEKIVNELEINLIKIKNHQKTDNNDNLINLFNEYATISTTGNSNYYSEHDKINLKDLTTHLQDLFNLFEKHQKMNFGQRYSKIVDNSIVEIRSRIINTTLITIIGIIPLLIIGGQFIQPFLLVIILGLLIGTYSSSFIVGLLMNVIINKKERKTQSKRIINENI